MEFSIFFLTWNLSSLRSNSTWINICPFAVVCDSERDHPIPMQQANAKHLMRYGTGLIMALLLGDVLSPSALRGACGDHVRYSSPGMKDGPASDHLSGSLPAPVPCTGPTCSRPE